MQIKPLFQPVGSRLLRSMIDVALAGAVAAPAIAAGPASACAGTLTTLYSFTSGADGGQPVGGVVADASGTLYGETTIGSSVPCTSKSQQPQLGCGTIYSYSAAAGLKVLTSFSGPNGAHGSNTLTIVGSTLYGTTSTGGTSEDGVLFSIHTDGTAFTLLHQFASSDGQNPEGALRVGPGNVFYGLTAAGGSHDYGVMFSIKPDGTYTVLHDFTV